MRSAPCLYHFTEIPLIFLGLLFSTWAICSRHRNTMTQGTNTTRELNCFRASSRFPWKKYDVRNMRLSGLSVQ